MLSVGETIAILIFLGGVIVALMRDKSSAIKEVVDKHISDDEKIHKKLFDKIEEVKDEQTEMKIDTHKILNKFNGHCVRKGKWVKE